MAVRVIEAKEGWNNYHTHTWRCNHASGDIGEYAAGAKRLGMKRLGFSEHAFIPGGDGNPYHLSREEVPAYLRLCREVDGQYDDLQILCAVECDYDPSDEQAFREFYLDQLGFDYLIGSVHELKNRQDEMNCFANTHFGVKELRIYTDLYVKLLESRVFTFCAHPDLFARPLVVGEDPQGWDANAAAAAREILEAARANGAVLEINVSGVWKTRTKGYPEVIYPRWEFWEMAADYGIPVIVNTDAHSLDRLDAYVEYGLELVRKYGLTRVELCRE